MQERRKNVRFDVWSRFGGKGEPAAPGVVPAFDRAFDEVWGALRQHDINQQVTVSEASRSPSTRQQGSTPFDSDVATEMAKIEQELLNELRFQQYNSTSVPSNARNSFSNGYDGVGSRFPAQRNQQSFSATTGASLVPSVMLQPSQHTLAFQQQHQTQYGIDQQNSFRKQPPPYYPPSYSQYPSAQSPPPPFSTRIHPPSDNQPTREAHPLSDRNTNTQHVNQSPLKSIPSIGLPMQQMQQQPQQLSSRRGQYSSRGASSITFG
jgi:hypothetical protein